MLSPILINYGLVFAIVITTCGCIPHTLVSLKVGEKNDEQMDNVEGHQELFSQLESVQGEFPETTLHPNDPQNSDTVEEETEKELTLPVPSHELSEIKFSHPTNSVPDNSNPFLRTKRSSTCEVPVNLTQMVQELKSRLNSNQIVGLNPQTQSRNTIPAGQPSQCHDNVNNKWWPRPEINLRSTCPWNLTEVDLGENAFPRYINKAICLCFFCIDISTMRCEETKQTVSYLYRQRCQDGLAVMEQRNITITVGCHCATEPVQSGPRRSVTLRPGPITP